MRHNPQPSGIIEQLNIAHIRGRNLDTGIENFGQQFRELRRPGSAAYSTAASGSSPRDRLVRRALSVRMASSASFLGRDIARDFGGPDDLPPLIPDRRDGQRNIPQRAVLAPAYRLEVIHALAPLQAREDVRSSSCRSSGTTIRIDFPIASAAV